jgi:hypothetical protein
MTKKIETCEHEKGKYCDCPSQCFYTFMCKAKDKFGYPRKKINLKEAENDRE